MYCHLFYTFPILVILLIVKYFILMKKMRMLEREVVFFSA